MIAMRDGLVPAVRTVLVCAAGFGRAAHGIFGADLDDMLVDMILVHVMKVTIMKIIDVAAMPDRGMTAIQAVFVRMVGMVLLGASHAVSFLQVENTHAVIANVSE
ncbi:MAG: hypothetical protein ACREB2_01120 [Pseudolabrys sp.]